MTLAQRIKKGLTKMIPGDKITYVSKQKPPIVKPFTGKKAPTYKISKTPSNGKGVGY